MYIVPGHGQLTQEDKVSKSILSSFIMILQTVNELEAKNHFLYIEKCHKSVINY